MSLLRRIERDRNRLLGQLLQKILESDDTVLREQNLTVEQLGDPLNDAPNYFVSAGSQNLDRVRVLRAFLEKLTETDEAQSRYQALLNTILQAQNLTLSHIPNGEQLYSNPADFFLPVAVQPKNRTDQRQSGSAETVVKWGTLPLAAMNFLSCAAKAGLNIIVAGPPAGGKTTLLEAICEGLTLAPVDELHGTELVALVNAKNPFMGTIVASNLTDALKQLELFCQMDNVPAPAAHNLLAQSIDLIVFIEQRYTGSHKVINIAEMNPDFALTSLWEFEDFRLKVEFPHHEGRLQPTKIMPRNLDRLVAAGLDREKFLKQISS
jgi:hypothetical protein